MPPTDRYGDCRYSSVQSPLLLKPSLERDFPGNPPCTGQHKPQSDLDIHRLLGDAEERTLWEMTVRKDCRAEVLGGGPEIGGRSRGCGKREVM